MQPPREARFVRPGLVAEIEFCEWTNAGSLRHPSYKGLREDKDAREVVRERPA
jgi:bifunctional non-homologous end joining protein LigD